MKAPKRLLCLLTTVSTLAPSANGLEERELRSGQPEISNATGGIRLSDILSHRGGHAVDSPGEERWTDRPRAAPGSARDRNGFQPSWREFRTDVGGGFRTFFSLDNVFPAAVIAAGTGISSFADDGVQEYFSATERLGAAPKILSNPALLTAGFGAVMAVGWFGGNEKSREATYDLALGLIVDNTVTFATKVAVRRERPDRGNFSFPSGHASNLFTIAAILGHRYGPKVSIPLHALAAFVSVSRMDVNSHWLSDTVAGAGLGLLVGHSILRYRGSSGENRLTWIPILAPGKIGVLLAIRLF